MSGTSGNLPPPQPDADSAHYWAEARGGRLVLRECAECARRHFPPRFACPHCWSQQLRWIAASGSGTVYTFTIMRRAPALQWQAFVPYVVALVDLDEGPRVMANIVGPEALGISLGERVTACFEARDGAALLQFRRRTGGESSACRPEA